MANKKTALITGSYGGLGTCFVNIHAETGGDLILVGRNPDKLNVQKAEGRSRKEVFCYGSHNHSGSFPARCGTENL